jgi:hypothetical protein
MEGDWVDLKGQGFGEEVPAAEGSAEQPSSSVEVEDRFVAVLPEFERVYSCSLTSPGFGSAYLSMFDFQSRHAFSAAEIEYLVGKVDELWCHGKTLNSWSQEQMGPKASGLETPPEPPAKSSPFQTTMFDFEDLGRACACLALERRNNRSVYLLCSVHI